ncbi:MAG TPA: hypothetical protein VJC10_03295 [Patescibacteria group bacterium]|nr:hypothetical protein [Patescibacteria group bacterium]
MVQAEQTPVRVPHPEAERRLRQLDLDRKSILLYLLDRVGQRSRGDIVTLAKALQTNQEEPKTLVETCQELGWITKDDPQPHRVLRRISPHLRRIRYGILSAFDRPSAFEPKRDPVLRHTALQYDPEEMVQNDWKPGDQLPGQHDAFSGNGPARPLLHELYLLSSHGLVRINENRQGEEFFASTRDGHDFAEAIGVRFHHLGYGGRQNLLVTGRSYGVEITSR